MSAPTAVAARGGRLVLVQAHCSALDLLAAALLYVAAARLTRVPGAWGEWRGPLLVAAGLAVAAGLGPWLSGRFSVGLQRWLLWVAMGLAVVGVIGAAWVVDLLAVVAMQLLLTAAVLAELGTQRRGLWWFWIAAAVLVGSFALYHGLVDVLPRPE